MLVIQKTFYEIFYEIFHEIFYESFLRHFKWARIFFQEVLQLMCALPLGRLARHF